jgi:hypothetical protein
MWYHGCNADYSVCSIGHATSPDGIHWTKDAGNPVLEATSGAWDEGGLYWPRVVKNGALYEMWYRSGSQLGRATSPDGVDWTKYVGNPVLSDGWDGRGVSVPSILLEGANYRMWTSSGAGATQGIGIFESSDGITWTQPVSNPVLVPGETGMIIHAQQNGDQIRARTVANTPITITVSDSEGVKATISGVTDGGGDYSSWDHAEDWIPAAPQILPGDTVSATTPSSTAIIETVGEVRAQAHIDTDVVEGTIHAPWFAPGSLSVACELYGGVYSYLDQDVPADSGSFQCGFSGLVDIEGGMGGQVGYLEPGGNWVSVEWGASYMEVFYGTRNGVGVSFPPPGHTFWITVTNPEGSVKASTVATSEVDGGWWGPGFRPTWMDEGACCDWSPAEPDIQPGDRVTYRSHDGYEKTVRVGEIYGLVDVEADSVTGPIYADWFTETLEVGCSPRTRWPAMYQQSSAEPDGSVRYFCAWQNPTGGQEPWDIQPDDEVMVHYVELDGDKVYRTMLASKGALPPRIYLPVAVR